MNYVSIFFSNIRQCEENVNPPHSHLFCFRDIPPLILTSWFIRWLHTTVNNFTESISLFFFFSSKRMEGGGFSRMEDERQLCKLSQFSSSHVILNPRCLDTLKDEAFTTWSWSGIFWDWMLVFSIDRVLFRNG